MQPGIAPELVSVELPELPKCDFCDEDAKYDGKTTRGPWAYMCALDFLYNGVGIGMGVGQRLFTLGSKEQ